MGGDLCPGSEYVCGSRGVTTHNGVRYCIVCGRSLDVVDDGHFSRKLAADRQKQIRELNQLLYGYSKEES